MVRRSSDDGEDGSRNSCANIHTDFTSDRDEWIVQRGSGESSCEITSDGLQMTIQPPAEYANGYEAVRDETTPERLRYNKYEGKGCTLNATTYMQYGKFSATVKSSRVPGAVTAVILIADNGDELDFEFLAGERDQITTNYFYGPHIVYGENGKVTDAPDGNAYDRFYDYTIEWTPSSIKWFINNNLVRTVDRRKTVNDEGIEEYPTRPARVQIGLWDGSAASGTAQWARGPIDWSRQNAPVTAYVKSVTIECDPRHNDVEGED
ncbi:concanavalin A-like lectin/glucanase domain-containing protein [Mycotypha africana]|uniref:concanavalin A-like lectin/glucanase domain-containing protein n=1 Tax=Mycotypha africana TaxID=64632 RepID=UPI00230188D5|nr:concanavalin A-like lectin/glucanase domain-containing protein [Mycotypha africana]KAI8973517.1 concanavalin A-like lectin/glucanase domain-containing protein [Mycotypha africana]